MSKRSQEALLVAQEEARLSRELRDEVALEGALFMQGRLLSSLGQSDSALAVLREQEEICIRRKAHKSLHLCLGVQARTVASQGFKKRALRLYERQEEVARTSGDTLGLILCLMDQARLYQRLWMRNRAFTKALQAFDTAGEHGMGRQMLACEELLESLEPYPLLNRIKGCIVVIVLMFTLYMAIIAIWRIINGDG